MSNHVSNRHEHQRKDAVVEIKKEVSFSFFFSSAVVAGTRWRKNTVSALKIKEEKRFSATEAIETVIRTAELSA